MRLLPLALTRLSFLLLLATTSVTPTTTPSALVFLRIEGSTSTIYEGFIWTKPHDVTTSLGGTHKCDGTNNNQNPTPGPTLTGALDSAAHLKGFDWDGTWFDSFEDYFITRVADSDDTETQFWGLLKGYVFTDVGGCQQRVVNGDELLIAYDAFNAVEFLKLSSEAYLTRVGKPVTVTVTNGATGTPVVGAAVGGQVTGADGEVTLTFTSKGVKTLKAEKASAIRSNGIVIFVI